MKKLLNIITLATALFAINASAAVLSTNITVGNTAYLLSTKGLDVYQVIVTSDKAVTVEMWDMGTLAAPFYGTNVTNGAYVTRTSVATNYVTSYVGFTGYTNWYTNTGRWTVTNTVAAGTNAATPIQVVATSANVSSAYDTPFSVTRGLVVRPSTNATLVFYYNSR
jgi:hypothetical protein